MILGFTESEHLTIVADKHHAVVGVDGPQTEMTLFHTHVEPAWGPTTQTLSLNRNDIALEKIFTR